MEVDTRTSQGTVLSGADTQAPGSFDLKSWQGLTKILHAARSAGLPDAEYAVFRDMVLQYAKEGGGNVELEKEIKKRIATFPHTAAPAKEPEATTPQPEAQEKQPEKQPEKKEQKSDVAQNTATQKLRIEGRKTPSFGSSSNDRKEPAPAIPKQVETPHNLPIENTVQETPPSSEEVPQPAPQEQVAPSVGNMDAHKARIVEIKRIVHDQVGNPVHIIDSENQIGRAYMTALLHAIKATAGGKQGVLDDAMAELEKTFQALLEHSKKRGTTEQHGAPPKEKTQEVVVEKKEEPIETPVQETPPSPEPEPEKIIPAPTEVLPRETPPEPPKSPTTPSDNIPRSFKGVGVLPKKKSAAPQKKPPLVEALERPGKRKATTENLAAPLERAIPNEPAAPQPKAVEPTSPETNPAALAKQVTEGQSELSSPEVVQGVRQLLSEWDLFKGSGFLGTGPGGDEHPLYKKLRNIPMAEVLSGRFEGSTPEQVRTIKDYINAWRNEQGVTYNQGETFEHYLRRVVQKILKRRKTTSF